MGEEWSIRLFSPSDHAPVIDFLREVFAALGHEFSLGGKDADIHDLEAAYSGNRGGFFVAEMDGRIVGTVGVKHFSEEVAELKRLYVAGSFQGRGIGEALCGRAIDEAARLGYQLIRLDTCSRAAAALRLFGKLGFIQIPSYNDDPFAEIFMEKLLPANP